MGRHSAPADDSDEDRFAAPVVTRRAPKPGRHAGADEVDEPPAQSSAKTGPKPRPAAGLDLIEDAMSGAEPVTGPQPPVVADDATVQIPAIVEPVRDEPVPEAVTAQIPAVTSSDGPLHPVPRAGHSDLMLLRTHAEVRARVAAAVLVPFVLYVLVLFAVGSFELRVFLIWIWIPLVSAGVLGGYFLDAGHRAHDGDASEPLVSG